MAASKMVDGLAETAGQIVVVGTVIADSGWAEAETSGSTIEDLAAVDGKRSFFAEECVCTEDWAALARALAGMKVDSDAVGMEDKRSRDVTRFSEVVAEVREM